MRPEPATHRTGTAWRKRVDLVAVAKGERLLSRSLAIALISMAMCVAAFMFHFSRALGASPTSFYVNVSIVAFLTSLLAVVSSVVGLISISIALRTRVEFICLFVLLLCVPLLGIVVACLQCSVGRDVLRKAGVKVGFFGVTKEEFEKLLVGICTNCGYDMRTLPGRLCPECGTPGSALDLNAIDPVQLDTDGG